MTGKELLHQINSPRTGELFAALYGSAAVDSARRRYAALIADFLNDAPKGFPRTEFPETAGEIRVFTAAGRTELGGNHTDHNLGKVLAASIQLDQAAVAAPRKDRIVFFRSAGYPDVRVDLSDLTPRREEQGSTEALVRGIAAEFAGQGCPVGGFSANAVSTVLPGSGLSSSAAVEVLFGRIFDNLYGEGKRSALEIAQIGQKAENVYFGKPCGLMDQTACASGGVAAINFASPGQPRITRINFDLAAAGYALCVVNTRGSHADLTPDYAAIPTEMKAVAGFFGKSVLGELDRETVLARAAEIRKLTGDRALLRALHFFDENDRVDAMTGALEAAVSAETEVKPGGPHPQTIAGYLELVNESGNSSWELLQNLYPPHRPAEQGLSLALALTRRFLRRGETAGGKPPGACRVHGGGFAGTIQAYILPDRLEAYRAEMEAVFGPGSVTVLRIRPIGAAELEW
ncbi:MAG: galactokinase [Treponema sp.]|jgi:galactokinase|nr:galactokinase [Treponema sp.]